MIKKKEEKVKTEEKYLDVNATMQGSLVFSDPVNLRINGVFKGNLTTQGNLVIGKNAQVDADIVGENIMIAGSVKGKIKASRAIQLSGTAEVTGDISSPLFSIEQGAAFNGHCQMQRSKMSINELSDYLSVDERKIMEWVANGEIPTERAGSELMFDHRQVETWLAKQI